MDDEEDLSLEHDWECDKKQLMFADACKRDISKLEME